MEPSRHINFQTDQQASTTLTATTASNSTATNPNSLENGLGIENKMMYPLENVLKELIDQEKHIWDKSHGIHLPVEEANSQVGIEDEVLSVGGISMPSRTSQAVTESVSSHLIRYGQLTKIFHRYFRKLEKEHSCLYLSGRKANFENLRLHATPAATNSETPVSSQDDSGFTSSANSRRDIHTLRDEELLVYRCAIMCAQFPMLSAPSPPDDRSPSPPLTTAILSQSAPQVSTAKLMTVETTDLLLDDHSDSISTGQTDVNTITEQSASNPIPTVSNPDQTTSISFPIVPLTMELSSDEDNEEEPINQEASDKPPGDKTYKKIDGHREDKRNRRAKALQRRNQRQLDTSDDDSDYQSEEWSLNKSILDVQLGVKKDHPFPPMVNKDMLCSLVRRAFRQSEEQQIQYEQVLRYECGRKSKGEILARELVMQMQVLENNAHPFYRTRNFVTRNGYDIWLQSEKQRIKAQLDKFWHFNLPKPHQLSQPKPLPDYHKAYVTLLERLISCESRSDRREPVYQGRTPSSPLSPTAHRLLTEFGLRYGVGELYRRIVYLDYLAKHFDYEIWYINHCMEELRFIRCLIPRNRTKMTATRQEMELLRNTVHLLHGQTDNSLTRIDRLFQDSDPKSGVAYLIDLLKEVLDTEQSLFSQRVKPIDDWLKRYLKSGFVLRYERKKEIIADEIFPTHNSIPFNFTPVLINSLLLAIREEVYYYRDVYQAVFRNYFNITPFAKLEFYRLLCADACSLCGRMIHDTQSRHYIKLEMLGLLYRLNERDIEWSNVIPVEMQQWRNQFVHLALIWMDVLGKQMNQWIRLALERDQWNILTFADTLRSTSSAINLPAVQSHISPFPLTQNGSPLSLPSTLVQHSHSAFTPITLAYRGSRPPLSESSGDISSELTSSTCSVESLSLQLSKDESKKLKLSDETLLTFGNTKGTKQNSATSDSTLVSNANLSDKEDHIPAVPLPPPRSTTPPISPPISHASIKLNTDDDDDELYRNSAEPEVKSKPVNQHVPPIPPQLSVVSSAGIRLPHERGGGYSTTSSNPSESPHTTVSTHSLNSALYTFPISNSPIDMITAYIRLASFVGNLLNVLTPKIRSGLKMSQAQINDTTELPSEVLQARRFMNNVQQLTEDMRIEFLKKIHKIMVNSLKLYADNLLCMDLCCLPQGDARDIVGDEMIHHLQRRNDVREIWGCRHVIERKYGCHPNGLPCAKNSQDPFESVTRDMCIRINNIHLLVTVFRQLESHIYTATLSPSNHTSFAPQASSENSESGPCLSSGQPIIKTQHPFPHRYRSMEKKQHPLELLPNENQSLSSDTGRSGAGMTTPLSRRKLETGFHSTESQQLMEYLSNARRFQLEMVCSRINRFFRPALSFLLKLKLKQCPIERRLDPIVTYLHRHITALRSHLYPQCFDMLLELLWKSILKDIEEEALLLTSRKTSTDHPHLLLQTITYLIKTIHDGGNGLSLDVLTSSTEYVLSLLDVYLQSTNRLIKAFGKLNGPQFAHNHVSLDRSPAPVTFQLIYKLSSKLHTYKKCFSGEEFVETLISLSVDGQDEDGSSLMYTETSSIQLGQYLLDEGILICVLNYSSDTSSSSTSLQSSSSERMKAVNTSRHVSIDDKSPSEASTPPTARSPQDEQRPDSTISLTPDPPAALPTEPPQFHKTHNCWYKFSNIEDSQTGLFYLRAQILSASFKTNRTAVPPQEGGTLQLSEFEQARMGTLSLILNVLELRSRKDKVAKRFLHEPQAVLASQQTRDVSIHKLFRI